MQPTNINGTALADLLWDLGVTLSHTLPLSKEEIDRKEWEMDIVDLADTGYLDAQPEAEPDSWPYVGPEPLSDDELAAIEGRRYL